MSSPEASRPGWTEEQGRFAEISSAYYDNERELRWLAFDKLLATVTDVEMLGQDNPSRCSLHTIYLDQGAMTRRVFFGKHIQKDVGAVARLIVNDESRTIMSDPLLHLSEFVLSLNSNLITKTTYLLCKERGSGYWTDASETLVPLLHTLRNGSLGIYGGRNYKIPEPTDDNCTSGLGYITVLERRQHAEEMTQILESLSKETRDDVAIDYNLDESWR